MSQTRKSETKSFSLRCVRRRCESEHTTHDTTREKKKEKKRKAEIKNLKIIRNEKMRKSKREE